jgi:cysteine synthase A
MKYCETILETIGNTPLVQIKKIIPGIKATVLIKVETFNPGNSIKDRMALKMLLDAEANGNLKPGGTIIECTSGNTGMGLAIAAAVRGYKCIFTTTDKQSKEKIDLLKALGADVIVCPTNVHPDDPGSYYSVAKRISTEIPNSFWFNQYDNLSNRQAHYESTGPEIWAQSGGRVDAWVSATGTGGTYAGVSLFLKERNPAVRCVLADPHGSALFSWATTGELSLEGSSITEGIGNSRVTANLEGAPIDDAVRIDDQSALNTIYDLLWQEGLFLGGSVGINMAAAVETARRIGPGHTVVTVLCDSGDRYRSRLYDAGWLAAKGLAQPPCCTRSI